MKNNYFVLTVKDYLPLEEQLFVENEIAKYIIDLWNEYKLKCIFIPTGANPIEENDLPVGYRIQKKINNNLIFSIKIPKTPEETKKIIQGSKFAVCTRMHSAIFAITEYIPLIAIAYEHKSIGLLKSLKLDDWYIDMKSVTSKNLMNITIKLLKPSEYSKFVKHLRNSRQEIISQRQKLIFEIVQRSNI